MSQYADGKVKKFSPFSKYPPCYKDITFWVGAPESTNFEENDFYELVRGEGGDLIELVECVD